MYHDRLPDEELLNMIDHAYEQVLHLSLIHIYLLVYPYSAGAEFLFIGKA